MAFTAYHNLTGSTGVFPELLAPGDNVSSIKSIVIANTHATATAEISLFIQDDPEEGVTSTFKLFEKVTIPSGQTLLLDNASMLSFDNSADGYGLYMNIGSGDTIDVFINR
tara:strand:- start:158 stop:490 length:333 start_codon:yes stop_codon:yes gene_type:complete